MIVDKLKSTVENYIANGQKQKIKRNFKTSFTKIT